MKLYIHQGTLGWQDTLELSDEHGNAVYLGKSELKSDGRLMRVFDRNGEEVFSVFERARALRGRFDVKVKGKPAFSVVKRLFGAGYELKDIAVTVRGDWRQHDYELGRDGLTMAVIRPERLRWGNCTAVSVTDEKDELCALGAALVIDCLSCTAK